MNSTGQLHPKLPVKQSTLEFHRIDTGSLAFPAALFDERCFDPLVEIGLFTPLVVMRSGDGFIVIDGCKRLIRARGKGLSMVDCMVVAPTPDDYNAGLMRISLNRFRTLHFLEKLLFITWLRGYCSQDHYRQICMSIGIDNRERFEFERLSQCDAAVVDAVRRGLLDRSLAQEIDRLDAADRNAMLGLFGEYRFSRQMQRELADWLPEVAFRERCTIVQLLESEWMREIRENRRLNVPQRMDHLRAALFNRRFPTFAKAKERWSILAAKLNPNAAAVVFKPAEAFEKNRLEINMAVTSGSEAAEIFSRFSRISTEEWERLIYPARLNGGGTSAK